MTNELEQMVLRQSSGTKQKISILRTLLHNPSILLLDEPFRHLDPHGVQRFRRLLKDHLTRLQSKTVILSTHQLEEARRVADTIILLNNGQVLSQLSAHDIKHELQNNTLEDYYLKTINREMTDK